MLGSSLTITINTVAKVLARVNDSEPYSATYFLSEASTDYQLTIKHTVPATRGASKESHLVRLDVVEYDEDGLVLRKQSVWTVMEASVGRQDATSIAHYVDGVCGLLDSTNVPKILARQS